VFNSVILIKHLV